MPEHALATRDAKIELPRQVEGQVTLQYLLSMAAPEIPFINSNRAGNWSRTLALLLALPRELLNCKSDKFD